MKKIHLGVSSDANIPFLPYIIKDVIRSYKILHLLFKMYVCFYVEECESRTKHGGGLCILH